MLKSDNFKFLSLSRVLCLFEQDIFTEKENILCNEERMKSQNLVLAQLVEFSRLISARAIY